MKTRLQRQKEALARISFRVPHKLPLPETREEYERYAMRKADELFALKKATAPSYAHEPTLRHEALEAAVAASVKHFPRAAARK